MVDRESSVITAAVWLGSLVLVGVPTLAFLSATRRVVLSELGLDPVPWLLLAIGIVEIAVALYTANLVTRVRLHGYRELHHRSTSRTLVRHAVFVVPAALVVGFVGYLVLAIGAYIEAEGGAGPLTIVGFALAVVAFALLVVRSAAALWSGRMDGSRPGVDSPEAE
ncbi:hypothetical protein GCM10028857_05780 [Salinarchaeum chitinilyticum]